MLDGDISARVTCTLEEDEESFCYKHSIVIKVAIHFKDGWLLWFSFIFTMSLSEQLNRMELTIFMLMGNWNTIIITLSSLYWFWMSVCGYNYLLHFSTKTAVTAPKGNIECGWTIKIPASISYYQQGWRLFCISNKSLSLIKPLKL